MNAVIINDTESFENAGHLLCLIRSAIRTSYMLMFFAPMATGGIHNPVYTASSTSDRRAYDGTLSNITRQKAAGRR